MKAKDFSVEWQEDLVIFTLRSPKRLNALTKSMANGLSDCIDEIPGKGVRAIVVTGEGRAFSAGTDLKEAKEMGSEAASAKADFLRDLFFRIQNLPLTSMAAVNGIALGGGMELALACTLRIAAPDASFGLPEVKLAVIPAYGGTQMLPALIGKSRATDIMLTGRTVKVSEAFSIGLVNRIASDDAPFLDQAIAYCREITANSQLAISNIRKCIDKAGAEVTRAGLDLEEAVCKSQSGSYDAGEGVRAFLEKRPPKYLHK